MSDEFGKRFQKKSNVVQPIQFSDEAKKNKIISFYNKNINTDTRFAITKDTEGGKYIRGEFIYFKLDGVEIYTDKNNIIFVDTINKSLTVRDYEKISGSVSPTDPEKRNYIVLYTDYGYESAENEFPLRWESYTGRTNTYESIKANLPVVNIDKSIVIAENVTVKDALSIREFISYLQNAEYVDKEEINLDNYSGSDYI